MGFEYMEVIICKKRKSDVPSEGKSALTCMFRDSDLGFPGWEHGIVNTETVAAVVDVWLRAFTQVSMSIESHAAVNKPVRMLYDNPGWPYTRDVTSCAEDHLGKTPA